MMGPALVHDWLYSNHETSRIEADQVLLELWRNNGVPNGTAQVMHAAVSLFGASHWLNNEADLAYLRRLYDRHEGNPERERFRFPLNEMSKEKNRDVFRSDEITNS